MISSTVYFTGELSISRIFFASNTILEPLVSPLYEVENTSVLQYANPQRRPIPRKPLSTPTFLSEFAISPSCAIKSASFTPVALSSTEINRSSSFIEMKTSACSLSMIPSSTALSIWSHAFWTYSRYITFESAYIPVVKFSRMFFPMVAIVASFPLFYLFVNRFREFYMKHGSENWILNNIFSLL